MPRVTFKAKPETVYNMDNTPAFTWIKIPALTSKHCDMAAFRSDKVFGSFANSDLFPSMLQRALKVAGIGSHIKLDAIPACVTVTPGPLLSIVTIELTNYRKES